MGIGDWGAGFGEGANYEKRVEARVFGQGINGGDYIFPDPAIADYTEMQYPSL